MLVEIRQKETDNMPVSNRNHWPKLVLTTVPRSLFLRNRGGDMPWVRFSQSIHHATPSNYCPSKPHINPDDNKPAKGEPRETGSYISGVAGEDFLHTLVIFFGGNELWNLRRQRCQQQKGFNNTNSLDSLVSSVLSVSECRIHYMR